VGPTDSTAQAYIRVAALAVFLRDDDRQLLVFEGRKPGSNSRYHRPLGGEVNHGELSSIAVRREMREELGVDIEVVRPLGAIEEIFEYRAATRHELALPYLVRFSDPSWYHRDSYPDPEMRGEPRLWRSLYEPHEIPLYPEGLWQLLTGARLPADRDPSPVS
jgi:ADP-ribose pyrophosphatase YjhB (NUDIX family)